MLYVRRKIQGEFLVDNARFSSSSLLCIIADVRSV